METTKSFTNSSQVSLIEYKDGNLEVLFLTGKKYRYHTVPKEIWQRALAAESIGKFLNSEIKGKYTYAQI